jgi:hypothetical protein
MPSRKGLEAGSIVPEEIGLLQEITLLRNRKAKNLSTGAAVKALGLNPEQRGYLRMQADNFSYRKGVVRGWKVSDRAQEDHVLATRGDGWAPLTHMLEGEVKQRRLSRTLEFGGNLEDFLILRTYGHFTDNPVAMVTKQYGKRGLRVVVVAIDEKAALERRITEVGMKRRLGRPKQLWSADLYRSAESYPQKDGWEIFDPENRRR